MSRLTTAAAVRTVAPAGLAVVAFLLLASTSVRASWFGFAVGAAAVLASLIARRGRVPLGADLPARLVLAAGALVHAAQGPAGHYPVLLGAVAAGLLGLLIAEPLLHRLARSWYQVRGLPAARPVATAGWVDNGTAWGVNTVAMGLVGLGVGLALPVGWLLLPVLVAGAFNGWLLAAGGLRWRSGHRAALARLTRALTHHQPRFLLYFSAPPGSEYQARMWLPRLSALAEPYLVVLREPSNLAPISAATQAPVVVCETFEALDAVMVPSLRAAFYVNNGMKNAHCIRFTQLTHVQLYHGDSDKAVTASPLNQLFDRVFVAGQAAIDRFAAHRVPIDPERLRIVGRPQVAELSVSQQPISEITEPVVLYAPTWRGAHADSDYCSLPIAEAILEQLLARGVTVILRPHPYTRRHRASARALRRAEQLLARDRARTGRPHRWGKAATETLSLFECMDASHAMICDVSSVASDYLYTGKPFAITDMVTRGEQFAASFPVARAAYVLRHDAANLAPVLADLLQHDPLHGERRRLRTYYLGDIPTERYAGAFVTEARGLLDPAPAPAPPIEEPLGSAV